MDDRYVILNVSDFKTLRTLPSIYTMTVDKKHKKLAGYALDSFCHESDKLIIKERN